MQVESPVRQKGWIGMKRVLCWFPVLLACQAWAGNIISLNLAENDGNQGFAGAQFIGPLNTDSARWNSTINRSTGSLVSGTKAALVDDNGVATAAAVSWTCSNTYWNNDGAGDDEHKLAVGYLDDGGAGVTVTFTGIPYARYRVYGLCGSDQSWPNTFPWRNWQVNGAWVFSGGSGTSATSYGGVTPNYANNGVYWTESIPGVAVGNYWTLETSGSTCTIQGQNGLAGARGSLTGVIIAEVQATAPALRAYDLFSGAAAGDVSLNAQNYTSPDIKGFAGAWTRRGGNARTARNFNSDAGVGPQPTGGNAALGGVWDSNPGYGTGIYCARLLQPSAHVNFAQDGTYYLSFYGMASGDSAVNCGLATGPDASDLFVNAGLIWNNATSIGGTGGDASDKFYIGQGPLNANNGPYGVRVFGNKTVNKEGSLFFVLRIQTRAAANDTLSMTVYDSASTLDSDPAAVSWTATYAFASSATFTHLLFGFNGAGGLQFDGVRFSTSWAEAVGLYGAPADVMALGFNFVGNTTVGNFTSGTSPGALAVNELAGAPGFVQRYWNNLQTDWNGNGGAPAVLVNGAGQATATTIEYDSSGVYGTRIGDKTPLNRLMRGYLDDATGSQPYVNLYNIPYGKYKVVLYADGDVGAGGLYGPYWLETTGGSPLTPRVYLRATYGCFAGAFTQASASSTDKSAPDSGNFVVFDNVQALNVRIRGLYENAPAPLSRGVINAFQIVEIPTQGALFSVR